MCMIDDSDPLAFCLKRQRKARKPHQCSECDRIIAKGEVYTFSTFGADGWVEANKTCSHCKVAVDWLYTHCGGACFGAVREDLEEHYDEGYREDGLERLVIGIRRKWAAFSGDGLLPLETHA